MNVPLMIQMLAVFAGQEEGAAREGAPMDFIWQQITSLSWFEAVIAISFGIVYLLYGWRIFRVLVVIAFGMGGMFLGIFVGDRTGHIVWWALGGLVLFAFLSVPLMKWCVSILGALAGGIITGGLWHAAGLPPQYIWAGGLVGVVAGGLISFILLKISVMLFTSLGGSLITAIGLLALLNLYELSLVEPTHYVHNLVYGYTWFLPATIILPTLIGMFVQNKFIKHADKWEI